MPNRAPFQSSIPTPTSAAHLYNLRLLGLHVPTPHEPCLQCLDLTMVRAPNRERRRKWSWHIAFAKCKTATQEKYIGRIRDVFMPPGRIGSGRHERNDHGLLGSSCLRDPLADFTTIWGVDENGPAPRQHQAVIAESVIRARSLDGGPS